VADAANPGLEAEIRDVLRKAVKDDISSAGGRGTEIAAPLKGISPQEGEEFPELHGYSVRTSFARADLALARTG
jgi:hypothetical protein